MAESHPVHRPSECSRTRAAVSDECRTASPSRAGTRFPTMRAPCAEGGSIFSTMATESGVDNSADAELLPPPTGFGAGLRGHVGRSGGNGSGALHRGPDLRFQLVEDALELGHQPGGVPLLVNLQQQRVVAEMFLGIVHAEPLPQLVAVFAVVTQDGPRIVELVGERNQDGVLRSLAEVVDVALFALVPRGLGILEGVAALRDDFGDFGPELPADLGQRRSPPWSSAASCKSAAIACGWLPPASMTRLATDSRCPRYGMSPPLRVWVRCSSAVYCNASANSSVNRGSVVVLAIFPLFSSFSVTLTVA